MPDHPMMQSDTYTGEASGMSPRQPSGLGMLAIAVASSLLASTCCVLPLVLVLLGITGAWMVNLTALRPWTPLFSGLAFIALVWAGYLVFRPVANCSPAAGECSEGPRRMTRKIYVAGALFVGGLLLFPVVAPIFY